MESMKANTESRPLAARAHASCSLAVPIRCELFDETVVSMAAVGTQLRRPLPAPLGRYGAGRDLVQQAHWFKLLSVKSLALAQLPTKIPHTSLYQPQLWRPRVDIEDFPVL